MSNEIVSAEKIQLFHEEIMQEEGIQLSELPQTLQKKIKGFNLMKAKYEKKPDEQLSIILRKRAVHLADEIQNYIEEKEENKI